MLNPTQFTKHIIRPALEVIDLYSEAAVELLLGTAIQESRLTYLVQIGGGPALGLFQMEPATHDDIWENYLNRKIALAKKTAWLTSGATPILVDFCEEAFSLAGNMTWNLLYAAAMCRIHYYRVPDALPDAGDISRQAAYWKAHYNTPLGAGTEQEYLENWHKYSGQS